MRRRRQEVITRLHELPEIPHPKNSHRDKQQRHQSPRRVEYRPEVEPLHWFDDEPIGLIALEIPDQPAFIPPWFLRDFEFPAFQARCGKIKHFASARLFCLNSQGPILLLNSSLLVTLEIRHLINQEIGNRHD